MYFNDVWKVSYIGLAILESPALDEAHCMLHCLAPWLNFLTMKC